MLNPSKLSPSNPLNPPLFLIKTHFWRFLGDVNPPSWPFKNRQTLALASMWPSSTRPARLILKAPDFNESAQKFTRSGEEWERNSQEKEIPPESAKICCFFFVEGWTCWCLVKNSHDSWEDLLLEWVTKLGTTYLGEWILTREWWEKVSDWPMKASGDWEETEIKCVTRHPWSLP